MILYLLKSGICLGALLLIYHFFFEKEKMHGFNRIFLLSILFFSFLVPLISFSVPVPNLTHSENREQVMLSQPQNGDLLPEDPEIPGHSQTGSLKSHVSNRLYWQIGLIWLYGFFVTLFSIRFICQLYALFRLRQKHPKVVQNGVKVVLLDRVTLPFSFLDCMYVSKSDFDQQLIEPEVWTHESCHIREKHSLDILLLELFKIVFWFNPFLYRLKKYMQLNHEFIADKAVTSVHGSVYHYQKLLLEKSGLTSKIFPLGSYMNYSITKKRFNMMYIKSSPIKTKWLKIGLVPVFLLAIMVFGDLQAQRTLSLDSIGINPKEEYEEYLNEAIIVDQPYELLLSKLNISGAKKAYDLMSEKEKEQATYFPFLEEGSFAILKKLQEKSDDPKVKFVFKAPPAKRTPNESVWNHWLETEHKTVYLDEQILESGQLENYRPADFSSFEVREVPMKNEGKSRTHFDIRLWTHDHYQEKYLDRRRVTVSVNAIYGEDEETIVPIPEFYFGSFSENFSKYLPSDFLRAMLEALYSPGNQTYQNMINTEKQKGFAIEKRKNKERKVLFVITASGL